MKTTITIAALIGAISVASANADTKLVNGCEIVDRGGYSNFADPTCAASVDGRTGEIRAEKPYEAEAPAK